MQITPFIINENGDRPLQIAVKRYRFLDYPRTSQPGLILLLAHAVGFNKETWEPFLEELEYLQHAPGHCLHVKEAWAFDCPNHGESASLNEQESFHRVITLEEYARSGLCLLRSGLIEHLDQERIVLIGHSVGAIAAVQLALLYQREDHKFLDLFIMIEPPPEIFSQLPVTEARTQLLVETTMLRRDIWSNKKQAFEWFAARRPWKGWDRRALEAYVEHGLRPLPTVWYPDRSGVTLSCHRSHECHVYGNIAALDITAKMIPPICQAIPIHVLSGKRSFIPLTDEVSHRISSTPGMTLTKMSKAGHLVLQEMPKDLAQFVLMAMAQIRPRDQIQRAYRL